ncbi:hypothetical protein PSTT_12670, partial [Puccinia striiformis]
GVPIGPGRNANVSESETLPIAETITSKEKRLDDLKSHLLPALHLQFADLWNSLRPSCLQVVDITTYTTPNDQDLEQFKSFRLRILRAQFREAFPFINILFCDAYRLLESLIIDSEASVKFPTFPKRLSQQADILLYRLDDQMYKRIRIRHCSVFLETLLHKPQQYTHRSDQEMIDDRAELSQGFLDIGTSLKSRFDPPLRVILIYLLPIIPETHLGYLNQNYYKDW